MGVGVGVGEMERRTNAATRLEWLSQMGPDSSPAEGEEKHGTAVIPSSGGEMIGSDGFLSCRRGVLDGEEVVFTMLSSKFIRQKDVEVVVDEEAKKMVHLSHKSVLTARGIVYIDGNMLLAHDRALPGGETLQNFVDRQGRLEETQARVLFSQLISGLLQCHKQGVVHWDLKPQNLLVDDKLNLQIINFAIGPVKLKASNGVLQYVPSQLCYRAPEIFDGEAEMTLKKGIRVDSWSCGIVLYYMLCGRIPFEDTRVSKLQSKIEATENIYLPPWVSAPARRLIRSLLQTNTSKRLSLHDVQRDPWLGGASYGMRSSKDLRRQLSCLRRVHAKILPLLRTTI